MSDVIESVGLVKDFGSTRALDGLDMTVRPGEVHGFLGPNGAGKSTTIRLLLGLLRADGGTLRLFGQDPWTDAVALHRRLAYVPGDVELWPRLTGGEAIDLFARLRGTLDRRRKAELCERFDLDPTKKARTYSKGNRQKVALVAALSCDAELFVLDEPTSGLDPLMEAIFQQVVTELSREGRTVLLSSHILAEVEALCDRLTIIRGGRTVSTGTLAELRAGTLTSIELTSARAPRELAQIDGVTEVTHEEHARGIRTTLFTTHAALPATIAAVSDAEPRDLAVHPPSLEQLFLEHYQDPAAADAAEVTR